ncbi:MAG: hypothetical protein JNM22_05210 [Saprospiraceae bacterium]|nr:hypothetical protein [Saprospiraceae bacterium]
MRYTPNTFFIIFIFFVQTLHAQPNWREVVSPAFLQVIEEVNDSIAWRRDESNRLRKRMNDIIADKKLDRSFIVGDHDEYIAEGMHKQFTKPLEKLQVTYDRDQQIVELENLHVALYYSDKTLFRWTELLKKIRAHPDLSIHSRWASDWNALPPNQRPNANSLDACRRWVADKLVCDVTTKAPDFFDVFTAQPPKVGSFDPEFADGVLPGFSDREPATFPVPTQFIAASYPMNGQFAFHRSESIPGVGYIAFSKNIANAFYETNGYALKARWTSARGNVVYTLAEFRPLRQCFYFNFPATLDAEMVYRLELVALPVSNTGGQKADEDCWRTFRGLPPAELSDKDLPVKGEVKITELYFRAGKYEVMQKPKNLAGTIDWQTGAIQFTTDEPLDEIEMYGSGKVAPLLTFNLQTASFYQLKNALKSKVLVYYLSVPRIQSLENVPLDQKVAAELDHTQDARFVRQTSQGNAEYIQIPRLYETVKTLRGDYVVPALMEVNARDSLVTNQPVPFIGPEHFKKRKNMPYPPTKCTLYVGEVQQLLRSITVQQQQIKRRMDERAAFFYELDKRQAMREKKTFEGTLEAYKKQEAENLPQEVRTILEAKIPESISKDFTILFSRRFPGTKQYSASLQFKPVIK